MAQTLIRLLCLLAALGLLGGFDFFAARALSRVDPSAELARMRLDDEMRIKRHLRICAQSEIISRGAYELTSALSGYSVTRAKLFAAQYAAANYNLAPKVADLKHICADNKFELLLVDNIDKAIGEILYLHRETKEAMDAGERGNISMTVFFAKLRPKTDKLEQALMKLRESDFMEVNRALKVPPEAPPQTELVVAGLAVFNAICGCVIGGLFVASFGWMKKDEITFDAET